MEGLAGVGWGGGDGNALKLDYKIRLWQLHKYTKTDWIINFKQANFMACKLSLSMAV